MNGGRLGNEEGLHEGWWESEGVFSSAVSTVSLLSLLYISLFYTIFQLLNAC